MSAQPTIVFCHGLWADGSCFSKVILALQADGHQVIVARYGLDTPEEEQRLVWATHYAPAADLFARNAEGVAWRSKPSWYIVANNDRTVHPDLERFAAERMGATRYDLDSSHVPMLSHPDLVLDVIRTAANAVQGSATAAAV